MDSDNKGSNGATKFLQRAVAVTVLATTIIAGVIYVTARLADLENDITYLKTEMEHLNSFMSAGERFTKADGDQLSAHLMRLEEEIRSYPPQWFRNNFDDLRVEVKELKATVSENNARMIALNLAIEKLAGT